MATAPASSVDRNFPTLRRLAAPFRWFFRSRRRVLTATAVLLAMIATPPLWWSIQLMGLPDIGDPFDVAAYRSFTIPDDRNAFVLYREAAAKLKPLEALRQSKDDSLNPRDPWSKAGPLVRRWLEENREAMELFRRGTERPDALNPDGPSLYRLHALMSALYAFKDLALLEASRLEDGGDMAGAWTWYRAALRETAHAAMRGTTPERYGAQMQHLEIRRRIDSWAADPRTTPAMLRRALDDAIACEALAPSDSHTIRADYLLQEPFLTGPHPPGRNDLIFRLKTFRINSTEYQIDPDLIGNVVDAWRAWRREPERSRRTLRLAVANWLAYQDLPPDRRPAPDTSTSGAFDFYAFGPEAPANARALSPAALDRWLLSTSDTVHLFRAWDLRSARVRERANHRALVVSLASQLYRRDHGSDPPTDEALVGPYLRKLPDDGLGDAGGKKDGQESSVPE